MKKVKWIVLVTFFIMLSTISTYASPSISLNITRKILYVGADKLAYRRVLLKPSITEITGQVKYKSSDKNIVSVNSSGRAYARGAGSARVTAYIRSGGKTYSAVCRIIVRKPRILFDENSITLNVGESKQVIATATPKSIIKWKISGNGKAKITSDGIVTGLKKGSCYVYAEANGIRRRIKVTVNEAEQEYTLDRIPTFIKAGDKYEHVATYSEYNVKRVRSVEIAKVDDYIWIYYRDAHNLAHTDWVDEAINTGTSPVPVRVFDNFGIARFRSTNSGLLGTGIFKFYPDRIEILITYDDSKYENEKFIVKKVNKITSVP